MAIYKSIKFMAHEDEIDRNHSYFLGRRELYFSYGLDNVASAKEIIDLAGHLEDPILEIGTGRGHTALALARHGYNVSTVDIDLDALRICYLNLAYEKLESHYKFYKMDARCLGFEDSSFRTIVSINFFHHSEELKEVLNEMDRVLAPGGRLILADINEKGLDIIENVHIQEGIFHPHSGIEMVQVFNELKDMGYDVQQHALRFESAIIGTKHKTVQG